MTDTAKLRSWLAPALVVVLGAFIAWAFAASTLRVTRPFALPFDDSYRYLIEARELARFDGRASSLWSVVLAPFYLLGVRGHALVWLAYGLAATLYVLAALGIYRFVRGVSGDAVAGAAAGIMALGVPSFAGASPAALGAALAAGLLVSRSRLLLAACALGAVACVLDVRIGIPNVHWLVWPLGVIGIARVALWAWRERRFAAGVAAIVAPFAFDAIVFAAIGVAVAGFGTSIIVRRALHAVAVAISIAVLVASYRPLRAIMIEHGKLAAELNRTSIMLGETIHRRYRDGSFLVHRRGALAYHADVVTRVLREDAFEYVDGLRPDDRTTHLALPSNALGVGDFTGDVLASAKGLVVATARWDHAGTAERPMNDHTGWAIVDRIDVGDLASERAHQWSGATNALVERSTIGGLAIDGGRTIDKGERFVARIDPAKPTRLILRTGGQPAYPGHAAITRPIDLALFVGDKQIGKLTVAPPAGPFAELTFTLPPQPAAALVLRTRSTDRYRVFHWFVLQPG